MTTPITAERLEELARAFERRAWTDRAIDELSTDFDVGHKVELRLDLTAILDSLAGKAIRAKAKRLSRLGGLIVVTAAPTGGKAP